MLLKGRKATDTNAAKIRARVRGHPDEWDEAVHIWEYGDGKKSYNVNSITDLLERYDKIVSGSGGSRTSPNGKHPTTGLMFAGMVQSDPEEDEWDAILRRNPSMKDWVEEHRPK